MDNQLKTNIVIIGMPGSGKSVVGKILANEINYDFYDMDDYIKEVSGKTIDELFALGEEHFRDWESRACIELASKKRIVISSGGGVVKRSENTDILKETGLIIYLNRPTENILSDLDTDSRPLLKDGKDRIYNLYNERAQLYKNAADIEVINDSILKDTINKIKEELKDRLRGWENEIDGY